MPYTYQPAPDRPTFGPLPEGDYFFLVATIDEPYQKNNKWILPLKLAIQPDGTPVYANPWAGVDKNGDRRDQIAEFLQCINKAPQVGVEPNWPSFIGAKGKCRLTTEIAQQGALAGKEVNKVHYFYVPKKSESTTSRPPATMVSQNEFEKARVAQQTKSGAPQEEDSLPY